MSDPVSTRYKEALRLGHVAVVKGRPAEAVRHYEEAASLAPQRPLPYVAMGSIYLQMEQPRDAARAFDLALERSPNDLEAMRGRARALDADGKRDAAAAEMGRIRDLEMASHAAPGPFGQLQARKAELERHVMAGAAARAAGDTHTAALAYLTAANGYAALNDFDAAMDACLRALEAQPGHIDVHFTMTVMYLRRGWTDLAVQRLLLIRHRLDVDDDPRRRAALHAIARDHRGLSPELDRLAAAPG